MPTDEVCLGRREDERESALARGREEKREREEKKKEGKAREKKREEERVKRGKKSTCTRVHMYGCVCVYCVYVHMYTSKKSALPHKGPNARRNTRILARASAL